MAVNKNKILELLALQYLHPKPELKFSNPYETLIATILSAQCTDKQVNKVTPAVFAKYPTICSMAETTEDMLYPMIKSCGFRSKSTNIIKACQKIMTDYNGSVPETHEALTSLPGVGRKTANVVLSNAFNIPAFAVDTHVFRVSNRMGLANAKTVEQTETQLMKAVPKKDWIDTHHRLILHGRRLCKARGQACNECPIVPYCKCYSKASKQKD